MAETVPDFEMKHTRGDAYNWKEWFNGRTWKLLRGIDFDVDEQNVRTAALAAARRKGITITTNIPSDEIGVVYIKKVSDTR
jgi:hypothetical protein